MPNVRVLPLRGDIDLARRYWLDQELSEIERFGVDAIAIIDLTDVRYLDSTFINAFLRLRRRMLIQQPDISVCIVSPSQLFLKVFEVTQLDQYVRVFSEMKDAYKFQYAQSYRASVALAAEARAF